MILFEAICHLHNPQKSKVRMQLWIKGTELAPPHTHTHAHACTQCKHTYTCPFPLPQLHNLNARDSLTKTSRVHPVIAVYFSMQGNSSVHPSVHSLTHSFISMLSWWPACQERRIMWRESSVLGANRCVRVCARVICVFGQELLLPVSVPTCCFTLSKSPNFLLLTQNIFLEAYSDFQLWICA